MVFRRTRGSAKWKQEFRTKMSSQHINENHRAIITNLSLIFLNHNESSLQISLKCCITEKKKYNEHISKIILLVMEQHSNNINIHKTIRCCYDCTIVVYSSGDTMSTSLATTQYRPALLRFHTGTSPHLKILHSVTSSTVTRFLVCKKRNRDTFFFGLIFRKRNVTVL